MKFLWIDTETTGVDPVLNDPIQISGVIVNKTIEEEFNIFVQPRNRENISQEALDTHGITLEQMYDFDHPRTAHKELLSLFGKHVDKYNKYDKFVMAGKNPRFDDDFLREFFKKCGDSYWYSWVHHAKFDVTNLALIYEIQQRAKVFNDYKLSTIAKKLNVELGEDAHDAMADIKATREVAKVLFKTISSSMDQSRI